MGLELVRKLIGTSFQWVVEEEPVEAGGSQAFTGLIVGFDVSATGVTYDDPVPFDEVVEDTDGFYNTTLHNVTIPPGLGGVYLATLTIHAQDEDPPNPLIPKIEIESSGPATSVIAAVPGTLSPSVSRYTGTFHGSGGGIRSYAEGDVLSITWKTNSTWTLLAGNNSFELCRISDMP